MSLRFSSSPIGRFRMAGIAEGISYITLLFIAMPIKYLAGAPGAVWYVGWVHGLLFVLYILALVIVTIDRGWSFTKVVVAFFASLIPFGTFIMDKSLRKEEKQSQEQATGSNATS